MSPWIAPRNGGYSGDRKSGPLRKDTVVPKGRGGASTPSVSASIDKLTDAFNRASQRMDEVNKYWPSGWKILTKRRCVARLERNETGFYGRCEFMRHPRNIEHYLERGLMEIRFKTEITGT